MPPQVSGGVQDASQRLTWSWVLAEFLPAWWPPHHSLVTAGMVMLPWWGGQSDNPNLIL